MTEYAVTWTCPHCSQWNSVPNDKTCHRCGTPQRGVTTRCDICNEVYPDCEPLLYIKRGVWACRKCKKDIENKGDLMTKTCDYCNKQFPNHEPFTLIRHEKWACRLCKKNIESHG